MLRIESTIEDSVHWSLGFQIQETSVGIVMGTAAVPVAALFAISDIFPSWTSAMYSLRIAIWAHIFLFLC
jgi:uncharacterized membrane protein